MPKASRRRQSHGANDFSGEIDTLRESMHSLEDKLCKVEKDKEHLRSFNQVLIEKLKNSTEMDLCLKVIFIRRKFEKQKEMSMLHEQKVVRQVRAFHESCLKQARKNSQIEIGKRAKSTDSGIDIIEGGNKSEDDPDVIRARIEEIVAREEKQKGEVKKLNAKIEELSTRDVIRSVCNEMVIQALQDVVKEEKATANARHGNEIKELQKQHEEERVHLETKIEVLDHNEGILKKRIEELEKEVENLKTENQELVAREFTKAVSSQAVIDSLEEIIEEQENSVERRLQKKDMQLKSAVEQNEELLKKLAAMEKRAFSAEEVVAKQLRVVEEKDWALADEIEKGNKMKDEMAAMEEKLEAMERAANQSNEHFRAMTLKVEKLSTSLGQWQEKADLQEAGWTSKISRLEEERGLFEKECLRVSQCRVEETEKHMEHIMSLGFDINSLQKNNEDFAANIISLERENASLRQKLEEEEQSKLDLVQEVSQLRDNIQELRSDFEGLKSRRRRRWWRRLVSCS